MADRRGEWVEAACVWEARTQKLGNVHPRASFAGTNYRDFVLSAAAIREPLTSGLPVGEAILAAVRATREATGQNTNLGIVLLLAPLAAVPPEEPLRDGVRRVLNGLTVDDAEHAFGAIRLAKPGGLGEAKVQDVSAKPTVTLLEAMALAADRDMIAAQYANGFADVFDFGVPKLLAELERDSSLEKAILQVQLQWLAAFPDSLIARKCGPLVAKEVQLRAKAVLGGSWPASSLDDYLRSDGNRLNPGTTADLIAASLYVLLRESTAAIFLDKDARGADVHDMNRSRPRG